MTKNIMEDPEQIGKRLKSITSELKLYLEKRLELILFNISEQITQMIAESIYRIIGSVLLLGGFLFLCVALAIYLGDLLGHRSLGYVIVGAPVLLIGLLVTSLRPKRMVKNTQRRFMQQMLDAFPDEQQHSRQLNEKQNAERKQQSK